MRYVMNLEGGRSLSRKYIHLMCVRSIHLTVLAVGLLSSSPPLYTVSHLAPIRITQLGTQEEVEDGGIAGKLS